MTETNVQLQRDAERPVIGDKYVLDKMLGQGGYSWVYLARHKNIQDLRYVVKLLKPNHLGNDQVLRRFEQEATTLARIRSPRIARIVDYGPTENGIPYIVSEYIEGVTMGLVLREHGPLSPWLTAHLGCQILEGLLDAHNAGVVHRDLKPDNILITHEEGDAFPSAMVLDFGIAKVTQEASGDADATVEGLACSPRYAAPEVLTREPSFKSDIYAMGLVLAEMLMGHPVYRGKHNLILASEQLSAERVPLPEEVLTGPLGQIINKACEKQQTKRYENVSLMLEELQEMRQTLMPFSEAAKTEIDLPSLIAVRNDDPGQDADTTALTANLHTFESRNNTASGTVNIDIDSLVAAQRATKLNRVLLPLLIVLTVGMLIAIAWVILSLRWVPAISNISTEGGATATTTIPAPPVVDVPASIRRSTQHVHNALGQAGVNSITVTTSVENAELWQDDLKIGDLPIRNVVTDNQRPLEFTVQAEGYEPVTLQIMQTGRVSLQVGLDKEQSQSSSSSSSSRSTPTRQRIVRDTPAAAPAEPAPAPRSSSRPRRSGDYFENPF